MKKYTQADFDNFEVDECGRKINIGGCGAASGLYDTTEKAIEAWNRRTYDNY